MGEKIQKKNQKENPEQNPLKLNPGLFREHIMYGFDNFSFL